jgi:tetratricopeptide (TPR) repeat protein
MRNKCATNRSARLQIAMFLAVTPWLLTSCASINNRIASNAEPTREIASQPNAAPVAEKESIQEHAQKEVSSDKNGTATAEYHFSMGQAYVAEGNPDRAIEEFKLTIMFDPNSTLVYSRLATEYVKKGMFAEAMETCKKALEIDPKFVDGHLLLAGLYSASHENDAALAEYDKVLKIDGKSEEAAVYRAQVLSDMNKTDEAAKSLNAFVKKNPDSTLAWFSLGRTEEGLDHFREAVVSYKKAIELRPSFNQPSLSLGYLYEQKKMNAQAVVIYKDLFEQTQDPTAANRIATIYLKEEKYDLALPYLESLTAQDSEDMNARVKLS